MYQQSCQSRRRGHTRRVRSHGPLAIVLGAMRQVLVIVKVKSCFIIRSIQLISLAICRDKVPSKQREIPFFHNCNDHLCTGPLNDRVHVLKFWQHWARNSAQKIREKAGIVVILLAWMTYFPFWIHWPLPACLVWPTVTLDCMNSVSFDSHTLVFAC